MDLLAEHYIEQVQRDPYADDEETSAALAGVSSLDAEGALAWIQGLGMLDPLPDDDVAEWLLRLEEKDLAVGIARLPANEVKRMHTQLELFATESAVPRIRRAAIVALATYHPNSTTAAILASAFADADADVREVAITHAWRAYGASEDVDLQSLVRLQLSPQSENARVAAHRLGNDGDRDPRTVDALLGLISADGTPDDLRADAIHAIGRCGANYARVVPTVSYRAATSNDPAVRSASIDVASALVTHVDIERYTHWMLWCIARFPSVAETERLTFLSVHQRLSEFVEVVDSHQPDEAWSRRASGMLLAAVLEPGDSRLLVTIAEKLRDPDEDVVLAVQRSLLVAANRLGDTAEAVTIHSLIDASESS